MTLLLAPNRPPTPQPVRILALLRRAGVPLTGQQLTTALGEWPAIGAVHGLVVAGAIEVVRGDDGLPCGWRDVRRAWGRPPHPRQVTAAGG